MKLYPIRGGLGWFTSLGQAQMIDLVAAVRAQLFAGAHRWANSPNPTGSLLCKKWENPLPSSCLWLYQMPEISSLQYQTHFTPRNVLFFIDREKGTLFPKWLRRGKWEWGRRRVSRWVVQYRETETPHANDIRTPQVGFTTIRLFRTVKRRLEGRKEEKKCTALLKKTKKEEKKERR